MAERTLILRVIADDRDLQKAMLKDQAAVENFGKGTTVSLARVQGAFSRTQKLLAGGLVGGLALGGIKESVDAASDLREQLNKADAVFKDSSASVVAWSKTTANAFGISQRAALTAAGTFGNLIETVGLAPDAAAAMSRKLVELAADLASFNNANPQDVLDALKSGLVGEAEPLRRFGVLLSEARVQQEAMAETGKKTAKSLTDGEKALARYNIILRDSAPAQGDFGRTSDGAANSARRLSANIENLKTNLGAGLVPAIARVTGALADLTAGMQVTSLTADQLTSDKGLRDKFVDAFGAKALFDVLNQITSEGLKSRPDEGAASLAGAAAGKQVSAVADAIIDGLRKANAAARKQLQGAISETKAALAITGLVENLDLGVDKAGLTKTLSDDLAALQALKAGLEKQIKAGIDVKAAKRRLIQVQGEIQALQEQATSERFGGILAALELGVDRAGLTKTIGDDLSALLALKKGLENQIKAGVDVASAQARLVSVMGEIASKQQEVRDAADAALQAKQFRALGLSATGGELVPGAENLQKQLRQLSEKIAASSAVLPSKLAQQLAGARKILSGELGKATVESRDRINQLFKTIRDTFDQQVNKQLVRRVQLSDKILKALGFTQDTTASELRVVQPPPVVPGQIAAPGTFATAASAGMTINVGTVVADDPDAFLRELQKKASRTTATARGRFPGRSLGLA